MPTYSPLTPIAPSGACAIAASDSRVRWDADSRVQRLSEPEPPDVDSVHPSTAGVRGAIVDARCKTCAHSLSLGRSERIHLVARPDKRTRPRDAEAPATIARAATNLA
jgi:hypothetical protein